MGFPLFHRTTRSVRLTSDGAQLLSHARKALEEVSLGLQRIFEGDSGPRESVTFACLPTIATMQMPDVLAAFRKKFPRCGVYVRELDAVDLFEAVREGEVDFGLAADNRGKEFLFEPLFEDVYVALMPAKFVPADAEVDHAPGTRGAAALPLQPDRKDQPDASSSPCRAPTSRSRRAASSARSRLCCRWSRPASAWRSCRNRPCLRRCRSLSELLAICEPEVMRRICVVRFSGRPLSQSAARLIGLFKDNFADRGSGLAGELTEIPSFPAACRGGADEPPDPRRQPLRIGRISFERCPPS